MNVRIWYSPFAWTSEFDIARLMECIHAQAEPYCVLSSQGIGGMGWPPILWQFLVNGQSMQCRVDLLLVRACFSWRKQKAGLSRCERTTGDVELLACFTQRCIIKFVNRKNTQTRITAVANIGASLCDYKDERMRICDSYSDIISWLN